MVMVKMNSFHLFHLLTEHDPDYVTLSNAIENKLYNLNHIDKVFKDGYTALNDIYENKKFVHYDMHSENISQSI